MRICCSNKSDSDGARPDQDIRQDESREDGALALRFKKGEISSVSWAQMGASRNNSTQEMIEALRIDGGTIVVDGIDVAKSPEAVKRYIIGDAKATIHQLSG